MDKKPKQTTEDEHESLLDKLEEATGGKREPVQRAGFDQEGNFEDIIDAQQAERG